MLIPRATKVCKDQVPIPSNQNVIWLQVPVNNGVAMEKLQSADDIGEIEVDIG
jgi:hypothetical protein